MQVFALMFRTDILGTHFQYLLLLIVSSEVLLNINSIASLQFCLWHKMRLEQNIQ